MERDVGEKKEGPFFSSFNPAGDRQIDRATGDDGEEEGEGADHAGAEAEKEEDRRRVDHEKEEEGQT